MAAPTGLYVGLLSGTSSDAVDAALVEIGTGTPRLHAYHQEPLAEELRAALAFAQAPAPRIGLSDLAALDTRLGHAFAHAALHLLAVAGVPATRVTAIGSHGQTVWHAPAGPAPATLQIGDPNVIAWRTGIVTVADFRRMDVAAGGQGAPLAPALHAACLRRPGRARAVLNLGGIANLTLLPAEADAPVTGFDTGPANALLDAWAARHLGAPYDERGRWAAGGRVVTPLLEQLLAEPYFALSPPKSTGRDRFNLVWLETRIAALDGPPPAPRDVQATLLALTCKTVASALRASAPDTEELLVCGGGVHNPALMQGLARALPECRVATTAEDGLHSDAVEAIAFAWLAMRRLNGLPGNLPSVTGASREVLLGAVYRP